MAYEMHGDEFCFRQNSLFEGDFDAGGGVFGEEGTGEICRESLDEAAGLFSGDFRHPGRHSGVVDGLGDVILHVLELTTAMQDNIRMQELRSGPLLIRHADVAAEL